MHGAIPSRVRHRESTLRLVRPLPPARGLHGAATATRSLWLAIPAIAIGLLAGPAAFERAHAANAPRDTASIESLIGPASTRFT
jgi:hypothetical protein